MPGKKLDTLYVLSRIFVNCEKQNKGYNSRCWEYPTKTDTYTHYKVIPAIEPYFKTKSTSLHRVVYAIWNDEPLEQTDIIMHLCDNRKCVNPLHLKKGTSAENNWQNSSK